MMLCCAVSANDEPVLSPWAKEEAFAAEEAGILPDALHGDLRGAGNRGQAVWYLVKLTETVLQKELPNTAEGVFPDMENTFFEEKAEKAYSAGDRDRLCRRELWRGKSYQARGIRGDAVSAVSVSGAGNGETTDPG